MPSSVKVNGEPAAARRKRHQQDGPELGSTFARRRFNGATGNARAAQNHAMLEEERDALDRHRREQEQQQQAEEQAAQEKKIRERAKAKHVKRHGVVPSEEQLQETVAYLMDTDPEGETLGAAHGDTYLPDDLAAKRQRERARRSG